MILPASPTVCNSSISHRLSALAPQGYFSDTVMYYGYYSNYSLNRSCMADAGRNMSATNASRPACASPQQSYKMPLAYFFTIQAAFFITCITLVYRCGSSAAAAPVEVIIPAVLSPSDVRVRLVF